MLIMLGLWVLLPHIGEDRVTVATPPEAIAGAACALPVYVTDEHGVPVRNSRVEVAGNGIHRFIGHTDSSGLCSASLTFPPASTDSFTPLDINVTTGNGKHQMTVFVRTTTAEALFLKQR